jgi:trimethylamine--corrinoid protein Co-methyltransferase
MPLPRLATDDELDRLHEAVLRTLETVGFLVQDDDLKASMIAAGGREGARGQVLIPREMVARMLAPRLASPEPAPDGPPRIEGDLRPGIGSQLAQFYLDPATSQRVPGSRELLAELARFGHAWQTGGVGPVLLCCDVPAPVEPLESTLTIAQNTDRVGSAYIHLPEQVPYLAEVGSILNGDPNSFLGMCLFAVTPLRLDRRAGGLLRELIRRGAPVWLGTQPQAGASAPVTAAGSVVLGAAEVLAGWTAAFAVDPEALPGAGICSGVLDMRCVDVSFCAPEAMLQDLLCVELFRERYGGRCHVAGGAGYTDGKFPGSQKSFESAFEALTIYTYTGVAPSLGSGLLESGKTFSPVQFMLDSDLGAYFARFARGVQFTDEDLALDAILDVGLGLTKSHLTSDHTLAHWRDLYTPRLLDRSFAGEDADRLGAEERLLSAAREQFEEVLGRYEPTSVAEPKLREIERVVQAGWRALCETERRIA